MIIGILIVSFLMDGIFSNYFSLNGLFVPLFSLVGLIVSYGFFQFQEEKFYNYAFVLGISYDLIYTDTFAFYAFLFMFIAFIIINMSKVLANNYFNLLVIILLCIILFRCITYFFLIITGNVIFDFDNLYRSVYNSLIINFIYGIIVKFICDSISSYKFKRKKYY